MRKLRNLSNVKLLPQGQKASKWQSGQSRLALCDGKACSLRLCVLSLFGGARPQLLISGEAWWNRKCTGLLWWPGWLILKTHNSNDCSNTVEHLLYARHCAKHLIFISSCDPQYNPMRYRWGNWGFKRLSNLAKVTQLVSGRSRLTLMRSGFEAWLSLLLPWWRKWMCV